MPEPFTAEQLDQIRMHPHTTTEMKLVATIDALTAERDRYKAALEEVSRLLGLLVLPLGETEREA